MAATAPENKENVSSVYNLKPNPTLAKLVSEARQKSLSTNRQFLLKTSKSPSGYLSVKSAYYL